MSSKARNGDTPFVAQLSRKVKACDECRRHKIRCLLPPTGSPPCTRCSKNGNECKITKSLQSILEDRQDDRTWKASVENRLSAIIKAIEAGSTSQAVQELKQSISSDSRSFKEEHKMRKSKRKRDESTTSDSPIEGNLGLLADAASVGGNTPIKEQQWAEEELAEPASAPGEFLRELAGPIDTATNSQNERSRQADIIDQGLITFNQACSLCDLYLQRLDVHVYSIVAQQHCNELQTTSFTRLRQSVSSIRKSPLLLLSICTVASLHCSTTTDDNGKTEERSPSAARLHTYLYNEFIRVSGKQSFVRHQSMDDVRALLIASWWLRDLSWILTASAVRLVTERGMFDSFKRCSDIRAGREWTLNKEGRSCTPGCAIAPGGADSNKEETLAYEEARLFYLVYIADHQAAIPFGRPPMTRQHAAVRNATSWLAGCRLAGNHDARLVSHVEMWVVAHDVVDYFGVDVHQRLGRAQVMKQVPRLNALIDRWSMQWSSIGEDAEVAHEADMMRLFIDAHAFRSPPGVSPLLIQADEDDFSLELGNQVQMLRPVDILPPSHDLQHADERECRIAMGARAVESAHRILRYYQQKPSRAFGQPIYPQVMLIFACLFLNKLSKSYSEDRPLLPGITVERLTLPNCERHLVIQSIEEVVQLLQKQVVDVCNSEQMCVSAVPGLNNIVIDAKRHQYYLDTASSSASSSSHHDILAMPSMAPFSGPFNFDLQSLDLLSDTRFLSGVSNDASLWYTQDLSSWY
jgi:hypothetical protein